MKHKKLLLLAIVGLMSLGFVACNTNSEHSSPSGGSSIPQNPPDSSIVPETETVTFEIDGEPTSSVLTGDYIELDAFLKVNGAVRSDVEVTWSGNNDTAISIDDGDLMILDAGTTTITATCTYQGKTYTDTCDIVSECRTQFEFTQQTFYANPGESVDLDYYLRVYKNNNWENIEGANATITATDSTVTVDGNTVSASQKGVYDITLSYDESSITCKLAVVNAIIVNDFNDLMAAVKDESNYATEKFADKTYAGSGRSHTDYRKEFNKDSWAVWT